MPPRRGSTDYVGVREHLNDTFSAMLRVRGWRFFLGQFDTAQGAARAYDATAWRIGLPREEMNFQDVQTRRQAIERAPKPRLNYSDERRRHRAEQRRLEIAEEDEERRRYWRFVHGATRRTQTEFEDEAEDRRRNQSENR